MTCYGTSVMYMIQSYGLVPPDMTREEFEYAFTPLNPKDPKRSGDPKTDSIEVAGTAQPDAKPVDLVTEALQGTPRPSKSATSIGKLTVTEATLRGANWGGFTVANIMAYMPRLLAAFKAHSAKKGYEFMKTHLPASGTAYVAGADEKWIESSKELIAGTIGADYFKRTRKHRHDGSRLHLSPGPFVGIGLWSSKNLRRRRWPASTGSCTPPTTRFSARHTSWRHCLERSATKPWMTPIFLKQGLTFPTRAIGSTCSSMARLIGAR